MYAKFANPKREIFGIHIHRKKSESERHPVASNSLRPHGLYSPWNSPGNYTGVGSCSLLQGIFSTQGLNPGLLHCRWILYQLSHKGSARIKVAYPFSREGNGNPLQCPCLENPRDGGAWWAAVYGVAQSRTRLKWLSSSSILSPVYLPDPGIELGLPILQADSLPVELPGK